jgi:hypothetical protein
MIQEPFYNQSGQIPVAIVPRSEVRETSLARRRVLR